MPVRYLGNLPQPRGNTYTQFYDWSLKLTRWFENWVSDRIDDTPADPIFQDTPVFDIRTTGSVTSFLTGKIYYRLRKDAQPFSKLRMVQVVPFITDGGIAYGDLWNGVDIQASAQIGYQGSSVASAAIQGVKTGTWHETSIVLGPWGLFDSVTMGAEP